jgi:16S rRNA G966 N2-methylase RsmD
VSALAEDRSVTTDARTDPSETAKLYVEPFPATRTGALYNTFSYPTKISPETIALFIAAHTAPGDTVLDVFGGSGTTGIAAKLCSRPTSNMLAMAGELGLEPVWGPRKAVLYDVSVLGTFVSRVMCDPPEPSRFAAAAEKLIDAAERRYGWLYETVGPDGRPGTIRHTIWSEVLACADCGARTTFWDAAVCHEPLSMADEFTCRSCGETNEVDACERVCETVDDPLLGHPVERRCRVPAMVYGRDGGSRWQRPPHRSDLDAVGRAAAAPLPSCAPVKDIHWGELRRSGYHTGISHLHHFYTPRNFLAVAALWELIEDFDEDLRPALRLLVLSFNATHSTLMTRVVVKRKQKSLVLTGAQSGVLYVSGLPVEKNVFLGVRRKIATFGAAFELVHGSESEVEVVTGSSTQLDLEDRSIDYVFTDPPFGDYIPYAELNQLNELWLGALTDRGDEIIISPAAGKDVNRYASMMADVFSETERVLADDGTATVVFHSAKADVWRALTDAYSAAGLTVATTSVLNKTQASFKQTVSTNTVKGDVLILLSKVESQQSERRLDSVDAVIEVVLADSETSLVDDERTRERLFSRFITRCLVEGVPVSVGVQEFYARAGLEAATE